MTLLLVLLGVNLATADLYPVVWVDEALHLDPAVNLYLGNGLRSTAWGGQPVSETWVGYTPLYAVLMAGWLHLFGFSLLAVRSFSHLLGLAAIGVVWLGCRRHGLLRSPKTRVALVVLAACGAGLSFSYRCGRPDTVLFLLFAAAFCAASVHSRLPRAAILLVLGSLIPIAGLQGIAYAALIGVAVTLVATRRAVEPVLTLGVGCGLGMGAYFAVMAHLRLWETFRTVTLVHNGLDANLLDGVVRRLTAFPKVAIEDPSGLLLLVVCLGILLRASHPQSASSLLPALFGATTAVFVPTLMCAVGRYALYYSWMAWIPLTIGTLVALEALDRVTVWRHLSVALLGAATLVGLPAQLALGLLDSHARSYRRVEEVVRAAVPQGAVAYCDPAAYYAAKPRAGQLFLTPYNPQLTARDIGSINAVVVRTDASLIWERPAREIERDFRPVELPAPPANRLPAMRLHWKYNDYASLRGWEPRPGEGAAGHRPRPSLPGAGRAPR
ncbi:MAG: hypothetical protein MUF10_11460 [Thermoanaerobaculaceae bacterium]|nr:hypothetical protein [Thermoanaerobaculaceae bacterium]